MRLLVLVALVGCSFSAPTGSVVAPDDEDPPADAASQADAAVDAPSIPLDAPPDAPGAVPDAPPDAPPAFQCPSDFTSLPGGEPGSTYKIYGYSSSPSADQSRSFANARALCASQGGFLAVPVDFAEFNMLDTRIPLRDGAPYFWIGITDAATEGTWLTVLETPPPYVKWGFNEPDGGTGANCILGFDTGGSNWGMYDSGCPGVHPFACECRD